MGTNINTAILSLSMISSRIFTLVETLTLQWRGGKGGWHSSSGEGRGGEGLLEMRLLCCPLPLLLLKN